jgi:alpha-tubulin suppressor-like RCC1 family protein
MVALAKHELSLANATFYSDMNNYATCLYMTDIVNLKNDEFNEEMDDFSKSRYFKFQEDVEALQNRIFKVIEATSDVVQKKVELRKIINKSIRMRKFYSY